MSKYKNIDVNFDSADGILRRIEEQDKLGFDLVTSAVSAISTQSNQLIFKKRERPKWEYMKIERNLTDSELNGMGENGWECYQYQYKFGPEYFFKRLIL